jgi:hypothetical protein
MKPRPLSVWIVLGTTLIAWFSVRMLLGRHLLVWQVSTLLGAWAPLFAAGLFLHLWETSHREPSALAAWMVRALAMHSVLLWLVGVNDHLRGPPGAPSAWNADLGGPLLLVAFVPVFALTTGALAWLHSVASRLLGDPRRTLLARVRPGRPAPYRGVAFDATELPPPPFATTPWAVGVASLGLAALGASPLTVLAAAVVGLAAVTAPGTRSVTPSVGCLGLVCAALLLGPTAHQTPLLARGQALPWVLLGTLLVYLALCEMRLLAAARGSSARGA